MVDVGRYGSELNGRGTTPPCRGTFCSPSPVQDRPGPRRTLLTLMGFRVSWIIRWSPLSSHLLSLVRGMF